MLTHFKNKQVLTTLVIIVYTWKDEKQQLADRPQKKWNNTLKGIKYKESESYGETDWSETLTKRGYGHKGLNRTNTPLIGFPLSVLCQMIDIWPVLIHSTCFLLHFAILSPWGQTTDNCIHRYTCSQRVRLCLSTE